MIRITSPASLPPHFGKGPKAVKMGPPPNSTVARRAVRLRRCEKSESLANASDSIAAISFQILINFKSESLPEAAQFFTPSSPYRADATCSLSSRFRRRATTYFAPIRGPESALISPDTTGIHITSRAATPPAVR
jgi:hypothetical protein